ncbi:MAG TPA: response regulator [Anaerolineae bacterium]|nr:response regulator [Anaerolineae bacterium]
MAIEHDWRLRKLIQANLEPFGLEVRAAVNALHSLDLLQWIQPDLILVDTDLPDMEFTHLLDRIQAQLDGPVPILVLCADPPSRQLRHNGHAISFLQKPFAIPALLLYVRQALGDMPHEARRAADG